MCIYKGHHNIPWFCLLLSYVCIRGVPALVSDWMAELVDGWMSGMVEGCWLVQTWLKKKKKKKKKD